VSGTTGYEFLNDLNQLYVDPRATGALDDLYLRMSGSTAGFAEVAYAQKQHIMATLFAADVARLTNQLGRLAEGDRYGRDLTLQELQDALVEVTAALPVYRTYTREFALSDRDRAYVEQALAAASRRKPSNQAGLTFLRRVLLLELPTRATPEQRQQWLAFVMRWQQFTGPVTAKGVEDTALYVYNRLISLNEVGGDPGALGISVPDFHRRNAARLAHWPGSLNATSTHDTKRGEDVRARINVLSEIPTLWAERVDRWRAWNAAKRLTVNGQTVPDGNVELFLYQTLVGAWPLDDAEVPEFKERLRAYLVKASKEAKTHTSWLEPNEEYEAALLRFADQILQHTYDNQFLADLLGFLRPVAYYGALSALAQLLLKIAAPGVPDFYQGTELWAFTLVDPDNRRAVDFAARARLLDDLQSREAPRAADLLSDLLDNWPDGRVKLYVTYKALHARRANPALFTAGAYIPLAVTGHRSDHVCAFARHHGQSWALAVVPRLILGLVRSSGGSAANVTDLPLTPPLGEPVWADTALALPAAAPPRWRNALTGEVLSPDPSAAPHTPSVPSGSVQTLRLARVFQRFPLALLLAEPEFDSPPSLYGCQVGG
jgi:(1->4)-alpha-D-glucan 1-alpha-D-glucosylmutase